MLCVLHCEFTVEIIIVSGGWKRKITEYFTRGKKEGNVCCYVYILTAHYSQ
jgi:hypothetical protein